MSRLNQALILVLIMLGSMALGEYPDALWSLVGTIGVFLSLFWLVLAIAL